MENIVTKKTSPLCFMPDGRLVCYCQGKIIVLRNDVEEISFLIPVNKKEQYFGWSKKISRLLRLGVRSAIAIDNCHVVLSIGNELYELDINKGQLSKGWNCGEGIRPLVLSEVKDISGIDDGIYFGGYLVNMTKDPVHIYHRIGVDKWEIVYTFQQGSINHVHNIVPDPYHNCLWIFTGDFDEASAIWKVTDNFEKVECVACNEQKYRSCVIYALPEGLLYATDAPFTDDFIYMMNTDTYEVKELFPIDGSCIYGCKWKDKYIFSSTVEGDGRNMSRLEFLFSNKRGVGIKDEFVHLYVGNLQEGFKEVYKEKKDCLPFGPFQFGVFKFPTGINNSDTLYFQPMATRKNDLSLMSLTM